MSIVKTKIFALQNVLRAGGVVLTQGAGDIGSKLAASWERISDYTGHSLGERSLIIAIE